MSPSPRGDVSEVPVEGVVVPKAGLKNALLRDNLYMMGAACFPYAREHTQDTLTGGNGITIARISCTGAHSR